MALVLASSIGITSFGLAGCGKRKIETQGETNGYYDVFERDNNLKVYFTDEWFCDVWAEDYDNNKLSGIVFELRDGKINFREYKEDSELNSSNVSGEDIF